MSGGKSGGAGTTYDYYGTIACGVCIGPVDALLSIIMDGQEVWPQGTAWTLNADIVAGDLYVFDAQTWVCTADHVSTEANAPGSGLEGWTQYAMARPSDPYTDFSITTSDGTYYGVLRFYWGTDSQSVDPYLTAAGNDGGVPGAAAGTGNQHPPYAGICYIVLIDFLLGQEVQACPNFEIVVRKTPTQSVVTGSAAALTNGQANLAAVVADLLTNQNCIGLPAAALDETSFNAVGTYCQGNPGLYACSILIDNNETLRSVLDKLTVMLDGFVRFNPASGLIEMGVYEHGVTPATYVSLTEDDLVEAPKLKSTSWQGTYSRATVRYPSLVLNYQTTSLHADDPRAWTILQSVREMNLDRPYITVDSQALNHGRESLRVLGRPQFTGTVKVRREIARPCVPGSYVLLDVDIEPNVSSIYQFFRVTKQTITPTGPITLELLADNTLPAIPWASPTAPVLASTANVPAIASARILEVPTILSGSAGAVIVLAERPSDLITGAQIFFDTSTTGTFPLLGAFTGFAAKATLTSAVAVGDSTVYCTVDTTQADADFFTQTYTANQAADDTMLVFLVAYIASGTDAGEVAEAGGYQVMEIASVSTMALVSAGEYSLSVLRGRQNTSAQAFATANTEVWLIPRANIVAFNNSIFPQLRANRLAGTTPAYGYFQLCPYTFTAELEQADAAQIKFHFPLNSAAVPSLALSAPAGFAQNISGVTAWPYLLEVAGTWSSPDGNLVEIIVDLQKSTATSPTVVSDTTFAPVSSKAFQTYVQFEQPGTYTVTLSARDATNLTTSVQISVVIAGTSGPQCALPQFLDANGVPILNSMLWLGSPLDPGQKNSGGQTVKSAVTPITTGLPDNSYQYFNFNGQSNYGRILVSAYSSALVWAWGIVPNQNIPFDKLQMLCSTPGSTINFITTGLVQSGTGLARNNQALVYAAGVNQPSNALTTGESYLVYAWASAPGFANSPLVALYVAQAH